VLYALIGTLVTNPRFGKPLVRLNFEQLKKKPICFSLRIRENAEAIAFTGAKSGVEPGQTAVLEAFDNVKRLLIWEFEYFDECL